MILVNLFYAPTCLITIFYKDNINMGYKGIFHCKNDTNTGHMFFSKARTIVKWVPEN